MSIIQDSVYRHGFAETFEPTDQGYHHGEPVVTVDGTHATIDARGVHPLETNGAIKKVLARGVREVTVANVNGQRFIGAGIVGSDITIMVDGIAGNDLGMLAEGLTIRVDGNAQDGVGNTMAEGTIIVDGHVGDVVGYAMRGGEIFIHGDVGYRVGINMKEFASKRPAIVIGGKARDFLGEYMAGGTIIVLGMTSAIDGALVGCFTGAGMCSGTIFVRGTVESWMCGKGVDIAPATPEQIEEIRPLVSRYADEFDEDADAILAADFTAITPNEDNAYKNLYAPM